jgi:branched-chain amino acid transport system ATP-binding protein
VNGRSDHRPALALEQVSVSFGGLRAVANVSFAVNDGEVVGLIGPNGAGKTTAFNLITGFNRPSAGRILFRGNDLVGRKPDEIAALGLVRTFQRTSVFPNNTVRENALIGLHRQGRSRLWDTILGLPRESASERGLDAQAGDILHTVGLAHRAAEPAGALPYGELRLLGVALALAAKPSMLLLDEPVSGMNPSETARFIALVATIRAQGISILLVEHNMRMVMAVSDRLVVLNHGEIIAEGPPAAVQQNPEVVRAYLGGGAVRAGDP